MDLTWAMTRLSSTKLFTEDDPTQVEHEQTTQQTIPRWSGYNSMICPHTTLPTVIGYCPMINGSSTEISTVYTVLKKAQNICFCLDQKDVAVTFDNHSPRRVSRCSEFPGGLRKKQGRIQDVFWEGVHHHNCCCCFFAEYQLY